MSESYADNLKDEALRKTQETFADEWKTNVNNNNNATTSTSAPDYKSTLETVNGFWDGDSGEKDLKRLKRDFPETAEAVEDFLEEKQSETEVVSARKTALDEVNEAMLHAKQHKSASCATCKSVRGSNLIMPRGAKTKKVSRGDWFHKNPLTGNFDVPANGPDSSGNGFFKFPKPVDLSDLEDGQGNKPFAGRTVDGIEYKNGQPNFGPYTIDKGIPRDLDGDSVAKDAKALKALKPLGWKPPPSDQWVLHHDPTDGGVGYVPRSLHDTKKGGVAHTGLRSMMKTPLF